LELGLGLGWLGLCTGTVVVTPSPGFVQGKLVATRFHQISPVDWLVLMPAVDWLVLILVIDTGPDIDSVCVYVCVVCVVFIPCME